MALLPRTMKPVDVNAFRTPELLGAQLHGSYLTSAQIKRICELGPFANDLVTEAEAVEVLKSWRALGCASSSQVEWNEVLTPCTGSNTARTCWAPGTARLLHSSTS